MRFYGRAQKGTRQCRRCGQRRLRIRPCGRAVAIGVGTARTTVPGWMRCSTSSPCRAPGICRRSTRSGQRRRRSRRAHPALESVIHGQGPRGIDRVRNRGTDGFARTAARAVLAASLPCRGLLLTAAGEPPDQPALVSPGWRAVASRPGLRCSAAGPPGGLLAVALPAARRTRPLPPDRAAITPRNQACCADFRQKRGFSGGHELVAEHMEENPSTGHCPEKSRYAAPVAAAPKPRPYRHGPVRFRKTAMKLDPIRPTSGPSMR